MDSMRTLNTSLPGGSPKAQVGERPEELLQSFRSAALAVTTLYKNAAAVQSRSHRSGYQDALDDLLAFLDAEDLGLGDGEGWKVRRWATERLSGSQASVDSEDEKAEGSARARSSSPSVARKNSTESVTVRVHARSASPVRTASAPPQSTAAATAATSDTPVSGIFTFRAAVPEASSADTDMLSADQDHVGTRLSSRSAQSLSSGAIPPPIKFEAGSRPSRHRHGGSGRMTTRSSSSLTSSSTAGLKRRFPFGDFFDLGSLANGKDGVGGKRSRYF